MTIADKADTAGVDLGMGQADPLVRERQLATLICRCQDPCVHCWSAARKLLLVESDVRHWLNEQHQHWHLGQHRAVRQVR